jgi:D-alanine-D-alanine ligase
MNIGITYDLRYDYIAEGFTEEETAEFDSEITIDAIQNALIKMGFETTRIGNAKQLIQKLTSGERWDIVFNICEGLSGISREAQVPMILEIYNIPYTFSDPLVLSLALNKAMTKRIARDIGITTSPFVVIEEIQDIQNINLNYPLFIKPIGEGNSKGINKLSKLENKDDLLKLTPILLEKYKQPFLLEEFLPGREFSVGITGTGSDASVAGVMEIDFKQTLDESIYTYETKQFIENFDPVFSIIKGNLADECSEIALKIWRGLGCRDGGRIDIRLDKHGNPNLLEINPLAGLNPKISDLPILFNKSGRTYQELIESIMHSALKRYNLNQ